MSFKTIYPQKPMHQAFPKGPGFYKRGRFAMQKWRMRKKLGPGYFRTGKAQPELKFKTGEVYRSTTDTDDDGISVHLTEIIQGTDDDERIGNRIRVKKIMWRAAVYGDTAMSETECRFRMMLVYVKNPHGAALPSTATLLEQARPESFLARELARRYVVLSSWYGSVVQTTNSSEFHSLNQQFRHFKKGLAVDYSAATGAATDIEHGQIFLFFISSCTTSGPNLRLIYKMAYEDV